MIKLHSLTESRRVTMCVAPYHNPGFNLRLPHTTNWFWPSASGSHSDVRWDDGRSCAVAAPFGGRGRRFGGRIGLVVDGAGEQRRF